MEEAARGPEVQFEKVGERERERERENIKRISKLHKRTFREAACLQGGHGRDGSRVVRGGC